MATRVDAPLVETGTAIYRRLGFSIYRATLWTTNGVWDTNNPYALELRYMRDLSKDTLLEAVSNNLTSEGVADEATLARWHSTLDDILTDVKKGDTITSLYLPGRHSPLFHNGKVLASIDDPVLAKAYTDIWLGPTADADMRNNLLGHASP